MVLYAVYNIQCDLNRRDLSVSSDKSILNRLVDLN